MSAMKIFLLLLQLSTGISFCLRVATVQRMNSLEMSAANEAKALFRKRYPSPRSGGSYDLDDATLLARFKNLQSLTKDENIALEMIKNVPDALVLNPTLCKDNFAVYSEKYGEEKAIGLVTRNPFILSVPTTGYGSAETAGGETMVMSYIIAYTRPFGKIFLAALFIALGKAVFINSGMIDQILK